MTTFLQMPIHASILQSLGRMQIVEPTEIQAKAIPPALEGRDILGSAQTGTGKTLSFAIPMIERCYKTKGTALVLAPTRELATQVMKVVLDLLGPSRRNDCALLIGGACMRKQLAQLKSRPRFVIGTPGRIIDHLNRKKLQLKDLSVLVMDETDRMLDLGFLEDIETICQQAPAEKQTLMFSATWPEKIKSLAQTYCSDPVSITVGHECAPAKNITHNTIVTPNKKAFHTLTEQLAQREGSVIIFVRTKSGADDTAERLCEAGYPSEALHGDHRQARRDRIVRQFRGQKFRVLVATDVASRGLDIPNIAHVISMGLTQSPEDYIHRIGRTARAGKEGHALCIMSPSEEKSWWRIEKLLSPNKKTSKGGRMSSRKREQATDQPRGRKPWDKKKGQSFGGFESDQPFKKKRAMHHSRTSGGSSADTRQKDWSKPWTNRKKSETSSRQDDLRSPQERKNRSKKTFERSFDSSLPRKRSDRLTDNSRPFSKPQKATGRKFFKKKEPAMA